MEHTFVVIQLPNNMDAENIYPRSLVPSHETVMSCEKVWETLLDFILQVYGAYGLAVYGANKKFHCEKLYQVSFSFGDKLFIWLCTL